LWQVALENRERKALHQRIRDQVREKVGVWQATINRVDEVTRVCLDSSASAEPVMTLAGDYAAIGSAAGCQDRGSRLHSSTGTCAERVVSLHPQRENVPPPPQPQGPASPAAFVAGPAIPAIVVEERLRPVDEADDEAVPLGAPSAAAAKPAAVQRAPAFVNPVPFRHFVGEAWSHEPSGLTPREHEREITPRGNAGAAASHAVAASTPHESAEVLAARARTAAREAEERKQRELAHAQLVAHARQQRRRASVASTASAVAASLHAVAKAHHDADFEEQSPRKRAAAATASVAAAGASGAASPGSASPRRKRGPSSAARTRALQQQLAHSAPVEAAVAHRPQSAQWPRESLRGRADEAEYQQAQELAAKRARQAAAKAKAQAKAQAAAEAKAAAEAAERAKPGNRFRKSAVPAATVAAPAPAAAPVKRPNSAYARVKSRTVAVGFGQRYHSRLLFG
jgi:hypothetical protein